MLKNRGFKKNKLIGVVIIIIGIIAIFAYSILYNGGLALKKNNFTEAINKQVDIVDKKIQKNIVDVIEAQKEKLKESQNNIEKAKGDSVDTTEDSEKNRDLEKIRAEVQKSKQDTVKKEKAATEEIKKETIDANGKESQEQTQTNRVALAKVYKELGVVYSQVESPNEHQIISIMLSTVSRLEADQSYDSSSDQASAKAIYSKLDDDSKNRIKFQLFTNVDGDSIVQLRQAFGL